MTTHQVGIIMNGVTGRMGTNQHLLRSIKAIGFDMDYTLAAPYWLDAVLNWAAHGVWELAWWQLVLVTLGLTHITIASVFEIKGSVSMAWANGGFDLEFAGVLDLAGFDALTVEGGAQIRDGHFAAFTKVGVGNISIPAVTIQGEFELEVNTGGSAVTIAGHTIQPATCQILIGATIKILGFELHVR